MTGSQPMDSDGSPAKLLAAFLSGSHENPEEEFEALCEEHGELAEELRRLHATSQPAQSVFSRRQPKKRPTPAPGLEAGMVLGDFRLVELIGQGGMGVVWEAEQLSLGNRRVAVKFVLPERVSPQHLDLFRREARASGRLNHPSIVAVHAYCEEGALAWIAMEFVPGEWTLRDAINQVANETDLPKNYYPNVAVLIARIADAMQAAHDAGVIHRDLKPQNILITPDDRPKVTDFGLARITDELAVSVTGQLIGSYYYMSPEQVQAKRSGLDHRTDVFSLGAMLYELLTLQKPFEGATPHEVTTKILSESPPAPEDLNPRIDEKLAAICMRAMEKEPDARYSTMREMAEVLWKRSRELEEAARDDSVVAPAPAPSPDVARKWNRPKQKRRKDSDSAGGQKAGWDTFRG